AHGDDPGAGQRPAHPARLAAGGHAGHGPAGRVAGDHRQRRAQGGGRDGALPLALVGARHAPRPRAAAGGALMGALETLRARIDRREAVVGVVGLGHIGLPVAEALVAAGFRVLGFEVDAARAAALQRGETPLRHLDPALAGRLLATGRFEASTDARRMGEADALLLCVPTGLTASDEPDLGPVRAAAEAAAATLRRGQLVVLESTTYPGTTRDV